MIDKALQSVVDTLNNFLADRMGIEHPEATPYVILENIAGFQQPHSNNAFSHLHDNVILTVVNIEKDTLPFSGFSRPGTLLQPKERSLHLKIFCLFSVPAEPYSRALQLLSLIIDFFHQRPVFDSSGPEGSPGPVTADQVSLTYEELNHLWTILGGKQLPSVMFRLGLQESADSESGGTLKQNDLPFEAGRK